MQELACSDIFGQYFVSQRAMLSEYGGGGKRAIARMLAEEGVEVTIPGRDRKKLDQAIAPLSGTVHGIETGLARRMEPARDSRIP
jgi:hypothetical protein